MAITSLNSQEFSKDLAQQAINYVPADLTEDQRSYVAKKVFDFSLIAGNHLVERYNDKLNDDQARTIIQFIGEWTFHKGVDTIRAGVPQSHWDEVLQQVAFAALQMAIQSFLEGAEQAKIAVAIELQVTSAYENAIKSLASSGVIKEESVSQIISHSNVDKMAKESTGNVVADEDKIIKYAAIAIVLKKLSQEKVQRLLSSFSVEEQQQIFSYVNIENLEQKIDPALVYQYLIDLNKNIARIASPKSSEAIANIKALTKNFKEEEIVNTLSYERSKIIDYVETCLFESTPKALQVELSPYIAKILYSYIKSKLVA